MTDAELIKALRAWDGSPFDDDAHAAADRIEALVYMRDKAISNYLLLNNEKLRDVYGRDELESKLAKAIEALKDIAHLTDSERIGGIAKVVITELEAKP